MLACFQLIHAQFRLALAAHDAADFFCRRHGRAQFCRRLLRSGNLVGNVKVVHVHITAGFYSRIVKDCKFAAHEVYQLIAQLHGIAKFLPFLAVKAVIESHGIFVASVCIPCKIKVFFQVYDIFFCAVHALFDNRFIFFFLCVVRRSVHHLQFCFLSILLHCDVAIFEGEGAKACHIPVLHVADIHTDCTGTCRAECPLCQRVPCVQQAGRLISGL